MSHNWMCVCIRAQPVVMSELFLPVGNVSQEMEQLSPDVLDSVGSYLDQARNDLFSCSKELSTV